MLEDEGSQDGIEDYPDGAPERNPEVELRQMPWIRPPPGQLAVGDERRDEEHREVREDQRPAGEVPGGREEKCEERQSGRQHADENRRRDERPARKRQDERQQIERKRDDPEQRDGRGDRRDVG